MKTIFSSYVKAVCLAAALALSAAAPAQRERAVSMLQREGGTFAYTARENGDRIPDYSYAGYELSEKEIPTVPNRIFIKQTSGDATALIQSAIDYVSALKPDANGLRGAVLLDKGTFEVSGELFIRTSGVVLRGSGPDPSTGTTLLATGRARETVVHLQGANDLIPGDTVRITDTYVPLGAQSFTVSDASALKSGSRITVRRVAGGEWMVKVGERPDRPGNLDLFFDRTVTKVNGHTVTFDVPLTSSIGTADGGGTVIPYTWPGRVARAGVELLTIRAKYNTEIPDRLDEEHAWYGIRIQDAENAWVRQVRFYHLGGSAVAVGDRASKITVEDCLAREFASEIAAGRRNAFYTMGQQVLFQRIHVEGAHHDFLVGARATGPTAFVQCKSESPTSFSGGLEQWSVGTLFDDVYINGGELGFQNRGSDGNGAGWTGANNLFWNCQSSILLNYQPPTAYSWAFGCWAGQFKGGGSEGANGHVSPRSFFYAQLEQRLGRDMSRGRIMPMGGESSTSPSMEMALKLTLEALEPVQTLYNWIKAAPMPEGALTAVGVPDQSVLPEPKPAAEAPAIDIVNGWLTWGGRVLTGRTQGVQWWNGSDKPFDASRASAHITRSVPARVGHGLTDDLDEMTDGMLRRHVVATDHNYGLWYDRRRDDHQRLRRMDGEVWPPHYELPFARSGRGRAWDGLTKYDLTRFNGWYFKRLADYAALGREKGLVLIDQHYFQHNILEAGAHYADFPWRPANNVNPGIPMVEPVHYAGDKRIFYDVQFYDVNATPEYAALHKQYIRKNLDNFPEHTGVIHATSFEYTGPFHFVKFWLETIGEWERETGKNALIALSTTKDVQDQVLADPALAKIVDIVDIRYWYEGDRGFNAPPGGVHLAPRQHVRIHSGGNAGSVTFQTVYDAVRRYRQEFGKAVIYNADQGGQQVWAIFMAGGSLAPIPAVEADGFAAAAAKMEPMDASGYYLLGGEEGYIIYPTNDTDQIAIPAAKAKYELIRIDPRTGKTVSRTTVNRHMGEINVTPEGRNVVWLR